MVRSTINRIMTTKNGYIQEQIEKNSLAVPLYVLFDYNNNFIDSSIFFNEMQVKLLSLS
jgi:hypothetical protein